MPQALISLNQLKRFPLLKCVVQFTFPSFPSYCYPGYSNLLKFHILISSPNTSEQLNRDGEKHHHIKLVSHGHAHSSSAQLCPQENLLQWTYWLRATAGSTYRPSLRYTKAGLPWDFFQPVTGSGKTTLAGLFLPNVDSPNSQPLLGDLTLAWSRHSQIFTQSHALLPSFPIFPFVSQVSNLHHIWRLPSPMLTLPCILCRHFPQ